MQKYRDLFNQVAETQEPWKMSGDQSPVKLWEKVDETKTVDIEEVLLIIRNFLRANQLRPEQMVGRCFKFVKYVSRLLAIAQIKHTVTIGNIVINGRPYFKTTPETIKHEMSVGFVEDEPAIAHAWITLANGAVIDLTVLSSWGLSNGRKPLKNIQAIYYTGMDVAVKIEHVPYFLGPMYIALVTTIPGAESWHEMSQWFCMIDDLLMAPD